MIYNVADVYCIGTYKCATTYLFELIKDHPQICVADFKEVHFFSVTHGDGLWEIRDWDWYSSLYADRTPGAVAVEFSPGYMIEPEVAERLAAYAPNAKLFSVLRDPVERARSHYHYLNNGKFPLRYSFEDLCFRQNEVDLPGRKHILGHGLYARNLAPFLDRFSRERVHFVVQEHLKTRPLEEMRALLRFMEVDESYVPSALHKGVNTAQAIRFPALYWWNQRIAKALERNGLGVLRRGIKRAGVPGLLKRFNTVVRPNPPLTKAQRDALREYYSEDVRLLSELVGEDLAGLWWGARADGA